MNTTRLYPLICLTIAVFFTMLAPRAFAIDAKDLPEEKRTKLNCLLAHRGRQGAWRWPSR